MTDANPKPHRTASEARPAENPADREARNPYYRLLIHLAFPLVLSLAVHAGCGVFAYWHGIRLVRPPQIEVGEYEASLTESLADRMADAYNWNDANLLDAPEELEAETESFDSLTNLNVADDLNLDDMSNADLGEGSGDGGLGIGDGSLALLGTGSGAGEAGSGGFGSGLGGGGARIGTAGIWDLNIRANKIAYVVDFSGSIVVAVDDLKRELKRSVGQLKPSQSFNVIIFYEDYERVKTDAFKPKLEPATADTRREFFSWIDRKAPKGGTEPLQAMRRALSLDPEAVFFFSDGYFDDSVVTEITRANRRTRARIYCLVFDDMLLQDTSGLPRETEGARRLKQVAEANGGSVKIVTGQDLGR